MKEEGCGCEMTGKEKKNRKWSPSPGPVLNDSSTFLVKRSP